MSQIYPVFRLWEIAARWFDDQEAIYSANAAARGALFGAVNRFGASSLKANFKPSDAVVDDATKQACALFLDVIGAFYESRRPIIEPLELPDGINDARSDFQPAEVVKLESALEAHLRIHFGEGSPKHQVFQQTYKGNYAGSGLRDPFWTKGNVSKWAKATTEQELINRFVRIYCYNKFHALLDLKHVKGKNDKKVYMERNPGEFKDAHIPSTRPGTYRSLPSMSEFQEHLIRQFENVTLRCNMAAVRRKVDPQTAQNVTQALRDTIRRFFGAIPASETEVSNVALPLLETAMNAERIPMVGAPEGRMVKRIGPAPKRVAGRKILDPDGCILPNDIVAFNFLLSAWVRKTVTDGEWPMDAPSYRTAHVPLLWDEFENIKAIRKMLGADGGEDLQKMMDFFCQYWVVARFLERGMSGELSQVPLSEVSNQALLAELGFVSQTGQFKVANDMCSEIAEKFWAPYVNGADENNDSAELADE